MEVIHTISFARGRGQISFLLDKVVVTASLDKFEDIRYPERVARSGMAAIIDFTRASATAVTTRSSRQPPAYEINVPDLDDLMKVIFNKSQVNLPAFTHGLHPDALEYLNR